MMDKGMDHGVDTSGITIKIRPRSPFSFGLREIWDHRELLFFFAWKEIKIKYKQAVLGLVWTLIQPLFMMLVFTLLLSQGLGISTGILPPPLYYLSGLLFWNLFSHTITHASQSMISNSDIIRKVYFPRLTIPLSSLLISSVDFVASLLLLLIMMVYYMISGVTGFSGISFLMTLLYGYVITALTAFGLGTILASVNVKYRDVRYILPFLIQSLFFITPVMYDSTLLQGGLMAEILHWNPLHAAIGSLRNGIHSQEGISLFMPIYHLLPLLAILLVVAIYVFRRTEAYFADIV
jgi:lipopolysaccharide transport system permease protein